MSKTESKKLYTSREAASLLGVTPRTIQLWSESGILPAHKTPGGHRRFTASALETLTKEFINSSSENKPARTSLRILIAEDEPDLRKLYQMTLSGWKLPLEIDIVKDGYEALIHFGKKTPDLLILDLNMPRMDGFHMLNVIHDAIDTDNTEIMVVTALSKGDIAEHGGVPQGIQVFSKPIPFDEIEQHVQSRLSNILPA